MAFDRVKVRSIEISIENFEFDRVRAQIVRVQSSLNYYIYFSIEFKFSIVRVRSSSKLDRKLENCIYQNECDVQIIKYLLSILN